MWLDHRVCIPPPGADTQAAERTARIALAGCVTKAGAVCMSVLVPSPASAKDAGDTLYGRNGKPFQPSSCSFRSRRTGTRPGSPLPLLRFFCVEGGLFVVADVRAPGYVRCTRYTLCGRPAFPDRGRVVSTCSVGRTTAGGKFFLLYSTYPRWPSLGTSQATLPTLRTLSDRQGNRRPSLCPCFWQAEVPWRPVNTAEC